jgi:hypothetical protein
MPDFRNVDNSLIDDYEQLCKVLIENQKEFRAQIEKLRNRLNVSLKQSILDSFIF